MTWKIIDSARIGAASALLLALGGCSIPSKCVEGLLYEDVDGDGVYTRQYADFSHEVPIRCVEQGQ